MPHSLIWDSCLEANEQSLLVTFPTVTEVREEKLKFRVGKWETFSRTADALWATPGEVGFQLLCPKTSGRVGSEKFLGLYSAVPTPGQCLRVLPCPQ